MIHNTLLARFGSVAALAALAWSNLPEFGADAGAGFTAQAASQAAFLTAPGSAPIASSLANSAGFLALPTSVMPSNNQQCSVQSTDPGNPPKCSAAVAGGVVQRCSAHIDSGQRCSAFLMPGANKAQCSTLGGDKPQCSVLQPAIGTPGPSTCSAFGGIAGGQMACSVLGAGGKQFCSVENPAAQTGNMCSTFGGGGGIHWCSALGGGNQRKNFCSTRGAAPAGTSTGVCSAHAPGSSCSIRLGQKGQCTSLQNAPAGSCSAFVAGSFCSVIGGNPGNLVCP